MCGNISLYSLYFLPGAGNNVHKENILLLFKTNKKVSYFIFLDQKSSIKNKKCVHIKRTTV